MRAQGIMFAQEICVIAAATRNATVPAHASSARATFEALRKTVEITCWIMNSAQLVQRN